MRRYFDGREVKIYVVIKLNKYSFTIMQLPICFFLAGLIDIFLTLSVLHLELEALFSDEYIQLKICELCL